MRNQDALSRITRAASRGCFTKLEAAKMKSALVRYIRELELLRINLEQKAAKKEK